jgi:hypothetical protein
VCETRSIILKEKERLKVFRWPFGLQKMKRQRYTLIYISTSFMRDVRLPPQCSWGLRSFGILRGVEWYLVKDVSGHLLHLGPWRWDQYVVPKRQLPRTNPRCTTSYKSEGPRSFMIYTAHTALLWHWNQRNYDVTWMMKERNACRVWWKREEAIRTVWTDGTDPESDLITALVLAVFRNQN